jgi:hypothetical protein
MAFITAYIAVVRGRPPVFASGNRSAINSHCSHVKSLGYALVIRSQGAGFYKSQHKLCELSYNSLPLLKHPLSIKNCPYAQKCSFERYSLIHFKQQLKISLIFVDTLANLITMKLKPFTFKTTATLAKKPRQRSLMKSPSGI